MNKIYKVIWNATLLAWVAVSELAKGKTKSSKVTGIIGAATVSLMVTFSPDAAANVINTDSNNCTTAATGAVGNINPGGTNAQATDGSGTFSLIAGCNAKGNNNLAATAYGAFSEVTGTAGTALGHNSQANAFGTAVGVESRATGVGSTALGEGSQSTGQNAVALGGTATGSAAGNVLSVANAVTASGSGAVAIGGNTTRGAQATGTDSIAIGGQSRATNTGTIAIGKNAFTGAVGTESLNNIAIGTNASNSNIASGNAAGTGGQIALGNGAKTTTFAQIAIGDNSNAGGNNYAIAIGGGATVTANSGVAVGGVAMGRNTQAGSFAVGVGPGAQATGTNSTALGNSATANNTNSAALGNTAQATGVASTALGNSAIASIDNSVALGSGSTTSAVTGTGFLTSQVAPTVGAVSVGNGTVAGNRRIQNVADGSAASDAVTVAQLDKAYDDTHTNLKNVLGGNAAYDATTNTYTAPTNIGGTGKTTIDDAIKATQRSVVAGSNIVVTPTTAADGSISYSVATSATPTFTSVTVNNAPTAGTDATNKTYVDSKAAASKTEVAAGTNVSGVAKTTGANGQDVYTVNANGTTASAGSSAVTVTAGTKNASNVTDYKVDLSTATKTDIQKGVDAKTAVDTTGLTFKGDTTATSATKKLGDTVSITGDTNISTVATTDGVQVKLNPNLNLGTTGSVATGATVINNAGITANKVTINNAPTVGTDATNKTYVDSKAAASKTEVAAGSNIAGVAKTTGANGQDVYTVNANGTTASAGSSAVTVTAGTKDANNVTDYKVDLAASTKTDIQKGVDAKTAVDSTGLKFKGDTATTSTTKKLGDTVSITGDTNISTVATTDGVQVKLNPNLDLGTAGSVKTGNTTINNAGVTADQVTVGGVVINKTTGINAGGLAITNVAAPTAGTDATNKTYVDSKAAASRTEVAAGTNVSGVAKTTGANGQDVYTVNANGTTASAGSSAVTVTAGTKDANNVTDYKVDLAASTKTDIQKGVDAKTAVDSTGLKFKGDTATTSATKKLGDTVSITGDTNISTIATTDGVQVKLNPNLDLGTTGSVKTGNTTINNAGVTADQVTVGGVVINKTTGINAGGLAITNVAAPTNNTDAANKKYVDDAGTALTNSGFGLKAADGNTVNKKLGEAVDIVGSNSNISTKVNAGKVEVALSNTLDLGATGSVTTGATVINNAGITANKVTINNAPTVGTDATNKTYVDSKAAASKTEVAAGSNIAGVAKTTGANGQDVYTVNANGTTASAGSSAVTVTAGTKDANNVTDYKVDLAASTKTDIQKGVDAKTAVDSTGLKFKGDTATTSATKKLGDTVSITGDTNISTIATTDGVQVKLNPNLDLGTTGSVKTGNTTINNAGVTADQVTVGGVVINKTTGINAGGLAITNVAAPTNNTDAANKKYVDDASTALTNSGFGLKAADGNTVNKNLGEAVEVVGADSNITTKVTNGQVAIELNKNLNNLSGITVNDGTNGTNGSTVIGKDGISVKDGSGTTIAGVDNTALTVKDGSGNTETSINKAINTLNASQGETDKFAVKYDKNADGSANYNSITAGNGNGTAATIGTDTAGNSVVTSGGTKISNVANGVNASDAVNKGQLDSLSTGLTNTGFGLKAADGNTVNKKLGEAVDVVGADSNITTKVVGGQVAIELNKNLNNLTGITVNDGTNGANGSTVIGKDGISVKDGSGTTIAGVDNTALTVKDGSGNTETSINKAINTLNATQGETDKFAVKYDKNADGSANYNSITAGNGNGTAATIGTDTAGNSVVTSGGTKISNVANGVNASDAVNKGQLDSLSTGLTNTGFGLKAADGNTVNKKLGEAVDVVGADSNITTKVVGGQVAIELNKNLNNLTGITVNDGTNGTNGSTVIGKDGISVKDGSGNTIAGVDNTALTVKDGSGNTETSINKAINTLNATQGETDKFAVKYDKNADGSANYNSITAGNGNGTAATIGTDTAGNSVVTSGGTKISNVANGVNASDAVNKGQLDSLSTGLTNTGFGLKAADGNTVNKKLGEAVDVVGADSNITTKVVGGQVAIELNKNLNNLTGITVNDGTNGANGSTVIGKDGISVKDGSGTTIAGVDNTALTVKDGSGNTETSINKAINTLNATQGETDKFAVKYDKNADGSANYNSITAGNGNGTAATIGTDTAGNSVVTSGGTKISNVANGVNASDAVNKGQLDSLSTGLTNTGFGLKAADGNTVNKKLGEAVDVVGADSNITTKVVGGQVAIELNKNLNNLTGITVNDGTNGANGSTVIGKDGISVKDGSGTTIAGVDNTALTVKDGSGNTETSINKAINTLNATQGETDKFAVKYDKNADGSANYNSITAGNGNGTAATIGTDTAGNSVVTSGGTKISNVANGVNASDAVNKGQLDSLSTGLTNTGFGLKAADGNTVNKKLGEAVDVVGADSNITTKVVGGQVAIELNKNLNNLTGITVNDGTNGTNGSTVIGKDGISVKDGSGTTIAGVDNTALTVKDGSGNTETSINKAINTLNATQGETDKFAVKYDKNADGSANYNSITAGNGNGTAATIGTDTAGNSVVTSGGTKISNVANGVNASDAVNKGQLDSLSTGLTNTGFGLKAADGNTVNKKLGEAVDVVGADSNITTKVVGGQVAIELNKNLNNLSGITVNDGTNGANGSTVIGKDGISVKDGSGTTIAGVDNTALTVKDGSGNTETSINKAINTLNATQGETDKFAVKYDKNADGSANYNSITAGNGNGTAATIGTDTAGNSVVTSGGTKISNVANGVNASDAVNKGQLDSLSTGLTNTGFGLKAADGNTVNKKLGEAVDVVGADSNITTKVVGGQVAIELNKNLNNLTGITVNDGTNGTNGSTVIGKDGISVKDGSGNTIAGVDNTALTVKDGSGNTETSINKAINTLNATQGETDKFAVKYDKNADGSANYNSITAGNGNGTAATIGTDTAGNSVVTSGGTKISNVANGVNASDAVNKGQLDSLSTGLTNTGFGLKAADGNTVNKKLGEAVDVVGADSNITTKVVGGQVAIELNKNLNNLSGITVNDGTNGANGSTVIGKDGISVKDGSGTTIAGVDNTALTVKDGSGNTETSINKAINTLNATQGETDKFAVKYDKNADGSANYNSITAGNGNGTAATIGTDTAGNSVVTSGGTKISNVANGVNASDAVNKGQLDSLSTGLTNTGFGLKAADGNTVNKKLGEAVDVVGADSNITTKVVGGQVAIELNKNLNNLTGITVNDGTNGTNGSTVIGKDGISVKDGSGNTIAGLDNTALTVKDGSGNTETSINKAINTLNASQGETDKFAVKYDKNADGSANYDNVTLAGTGGTTITNVKAGALTSTSTDAVNGSQLYDVANSVKNVIGGSTTRDAITGAITTTNIGGTGSNTVDGAISSVKDSATKAKTTVTAGDNIVVTAGTNADGSSNYQVTTTKDVNFDKVTVGNVVVDKVNDTIQGLSNKDLNASDFATKGRAATEEQLKAVITSNITEVEDGNGNKVNIIDQVVNTKPDNKNQDSLFLTYDKQGQETTDRLTIGQTVQKMNTDGIKFFHTNADTSKGDLGTTNDSSAGGLNSTAIGVNAIVANGADSSVALGHNTKANGKQSIAIGSGAEALGNQSISIGTGNKVSGNHSGAIGDPTIVDGANSYSVGNNNQVLTDDTFVLGNNVTKTVAGSVVLGNGSAATTGAGEAGYALSVATNADKAAINKTTSTTGAVAVGDASSGIYRQITGVAAGSVDSDAVNVAQLKAVGNQVVTTQTTLVNSLGGNAKVNADGTITGPTYNVAQGNQSNVGDALTALDNAINTAATTSKSTVSNGQNIVVNKSKNADGSDNYEVSTAKDLIVDSVKAGDTVLNNAGITIGNNTVVLNNAGLTINGGPSVTVAGIDAGNKTIQNVANAVNATDAVNKGQLDSAISNVNNNVNELANNAVKYDDASKDKITLGGGANGTTITNVKDGTVAQGSKDAVNGGQLWNVQQQVDQNTTDISNIKNDINNGSVGLVQQAGKDATVTVAKDTGGTSVSVAGTDGNRVVTGVKEGAVNATSKDAVNGSQLNTTNQAVVNYLGGGAGYDNITGSFTAPSYTVGDSKYNNVGGAIDALNQADQALNSKIDNVSNKLDNAFRITNNRIDDVEKKANAGIAAAMALESAPYIPGKYTYAAGAAYHGGENAVGVTLRKTADNGRWSITGGVAAASQGDPSVRIGISGVID